MTEDVSYKVQNLQVYKLAHDYLDQIYEIAGKLPKSEKFNLSSQLTRAVTPIVLNIAEGSTGQSNAEQKRFLGLALRSYLETIACLDVVARRRYLPMYGLRDMISFGHRLFVSLQAFRKALGVPVAGPQSPVR